MNKIISQQYPRGIEDNIRFADNIYDMVKVDCENKFPLERGDKKRLAFLL